MASNDEVGWNGRRNDGHKIVVVVVVQRGLDRGVATAGRLRVRGRRSGSSKSVVKVGRCRRCSKKAGIGRLNESRWTRSSSPL